MFGGLLGSVLGGVLSGGIGAIGSGKASKAQAKQLKKAMEIQGDVLKANQKTIEGGTKWQNNAAESAWKTNYQTSNDLRRRGEGLAGANYADTMSMWAPHAQTGNNALQAYASNLGLGDAPEGYSLELNPSTRFLMEQGRETTEGGAAGAGGLYSGQTMLDLDKMRMGYASQDKNQQMSELMNLGNIGQNALGQMTNAGNQYFNNMYGIGADHANSIIGGSSDRTDRLMGNAAGRTNALTAGRTHYGDQMAGLLTGLGQSNAQGKMNQTNSLLGGLQNIFGGIGLGGY